MKLRPYRYGDPRDYLVALAVLFPWIVLIVFGVLRSLASHNDPLRCMLDGGGCATAVATYMLAFFASVAFAVASYGGVYALRTYRNETRPVVVAHACSETQNEQCKTERCLRFYLRKPDADFRDVTGNVAASLHEYYEYAIDFENAGRSPLFSCTVETIIYEPVTERAFQQRPKLEIGHLGVSRVVHVSLFVHREIADKHSLRFGDEFRCKDSDNMEESGVFRGPETLMARSRVTTEDTVEETQVDGTKPARPQ